MKNIIKSIVFRIKNWKGGGMARISKKKIRDDLIKQLEERGLEKMCHYVSLVDDYCRLWEVKDMLFEDISQRGVNVPYNNGGGQSGFKRNDSVSELTRVNAQMLKILSELGLRGADIEAKEEEVEL